MAISVKVIRWKSVNQVKIYRTIHLKIINGIMGQSIPHPAADDCEQQLFDLRSAVPQQAFQQLQATAQLLRGPNSYRSAQQLFGLHSPVPQQAFSCKLWRSCCVEKTAAAHSSV